MARSGPDLALAANKPRPHHPLEAPDRAAGRGSPWAHPRRHRGGCTQRSLWESRKTGCFPQPDDVNYAAPPGLCVTSTR